MLSKVASSTFFWIFDMTRPGIEPRSPRPLANTLLIWPMASLYINQFIPLSGIRNILLVSFFFFLFFFFCSVWLFLFFLFAFFFFFATFIVWINQWIILTFFHNAHCYDSCLNRIKHVTQRTKILRYQTLIMNAFIHYKLWKIFELLYVDQ